MHSDQLMFDPLNCCSHEFYTITKSTEDSKMKSRVKVVAQNDEQATMVETATKPRYDDKYITLTDTTLILKAYYFPMGSKTIPLNIIERIWIGTDPELGLESIMQTKSWGVAGSNVWWSRKMGRELDDNNECNFVVSLKNKSMFRCGFSVEEPETFRSLVGEYIIQKGD